MTDADRIADLEAKVADLTEICANLHNAIYAGMMMQIDSQRVGLMSLARQDIPQHLLLAVDERADALDLALKRAKLLIWGPTDAEK